MATFGYLLQTKNVKEKAKEDLRRRLKKSHYPYLADELIGPSERERRVVSPSPSPSLSLPVVSKTVYCRVCQQDDSGRKMDWYVLKLSSNDNRSKRKRGKGTFKEIGPIWEKAEIPLWSTCVALGSIIYSIGGGKNRQEFSNKVRVMDTRSMCNQWEQVAKMNARRKCAQVVTVDDKIYVFGGVFDSRGELAIEVFDPSDNTWGRVTEPSVPYGFKFEFFVTYDDAKKRIICGSVTSGILLAYDVTKALWAIVDYTFGGVMINVTKVVMFDNSLYWIGMQTELRADIVVYDMHLKSWVSAPIIGLDPCFYFDRTFHLAPFFHLCGNEFYLLWLDCKDIHRKRHSLIQCVRILVSKRVDKEKEKIHVKAYVLSTKTYLLPERLDLMDAVVLEGLTNDKEMDKLEDAVTDDVC